MNLLQDLRNKVFTINQQALSFAQQLALNNEASLKTVDEYTQRALQQVQGGQTAVNSSLLTGYSPTTSYGISSGQQTTGTLAQTGQTTTKKAYDPNDPSTWG
jgi:hypothetical protein